MHAVYEVDPPADAAFLFAAVVWVHRSAQAFNLWVPVRSFAEMNARRASMAPLRATALLKCLIVGGKATLL